MQILGLHAFTHDASAALIRDGKVIAAAEEERFNRIKHTWLFPINAITFCLKEGGVALKDLDAIAVAWNPFLDLEKKIACTLRYMPGSIKSFFPASDNRIMGNFGLWVSYVTLRRTFKKHFSGPVPRIHYLTHHKAHAASAFLAGPFEEAVILTLDASGEWFTTYAGEGLSNGDIRDLAAVPFPHSLGYFYGAATQYLGFLEKCDEGKVMAMATMAEPIFMDTFRKIVPYNGGTDYRLDLKYFNHQYDTKRNWYSDELSKAVGPGRERSNVKVSDYPEERHFQVAASAQLRLEEVVLGMVSELHRRTGKKNLCLAGGVALNSVMNSKVMAKGPFDDIYIHPAANDSGSALGAALLLEWRLTGKRYGENLRHAYLGPAFGANEIRSALEEKGVKYYTPPNFPAEVARLISEGSVVGFFAGRMEWGPRALGARSILADPRMPEMKDKLNKKVKFRETFRPFAPSILEEKRADWFVESWKSPFMLLVERSRPEVQDRIPSALHVDHTGRLQTVNKTDSPLFYSVIQEFERLTGIPVIINTSFNIKGEPIVCTPRDAVNCFLGTGIDALAAPPFIALKEQMNGQ